MFVKSLEVTNFRNYKKQQLELSNGTHIFTGGNGMGKTNLLEAVYFSSIGRSPRTPRDKELILWDEDKARVNLISEKAAGDEKVEIVISRNENKRITINGLPISKIGELMGVINTVFFSPSELKIVQSSPGERRSFMDIALCQISKAYFYLLSRYGKILQQRNKLLKSGNATNDSLDIWDLQLAQIGAKVIKNRKGFLQSLAPLAKENHEFLSDGKESLVISYEGFSGERLEEIEAAFLKQLNLDRERDKKFGFTHAGPHRDDMLLRIGSVDIRTYGSQGQQRTTALSLKLSELKMFEEMRGESPVLLLDDVLSELDTTRQQKLLERVKGVQTLIACTHLESSVRDLVGAMCEYRVENGVVYN